MSDCIFCKIVSGEISSSKVYEDAHCVAILDIRPVTPGHALVITKKHSDSLTDMDEATSAGILPAVAKVGKAVVKAAGAEGFNVIQNNGKAAGQLVAHLHFHIIPRKENDGLKLKWNQKPYPDGEMAVWLEKIKTNL